MKIQRGFTLVELMIVVAILGVLTLIALPQYQKYIAKAQLTEMLTLTNHLKKLSIINYEEDGQCREQRYWEGNQSSVIGKYGMANINVYEPDPYDPTNLKAIYPCIVQYSSIKHNSDWYMNIVSTTSNLLPSYESIIYWNAEGQTRMFVMFIKQDENGYDEATTGSIQIFKDSLPEGIEVVDDLIPFE